MTELETMHRAKMYIDKLANGIDPITGRVMPQDAVLNNVRISRCLFFVSDIIRRVIENGGEVGRKYNNEKKLPFSISHDEAAKIPVLDRHMYISYFCDHISAAVGHADQKPLSHKVVSNWLVEKGFLKVVDIGGKSRKRVTEHGLSIGISEESKEGQYGNYISILYDPQAQQFILDNLPDMLGVSDKEKEEAAY